MTRMEKLAELIATGLVTKRPHPTLPLFIYNYSNKAQFMPPHEWTPEMCEARGLILDHDGNVISTPFRKFWNYTQVANVPDEPFLVFEKLDGSLGVVANYAGQRVIATRGSFESEQAIWAAKWFNERHPDFVPEAGDTWLFEIIYPENRIVVEYGERAECVLLAVMRDWTDVDSIFEAAPFVKARRFDGIHDFAVVNGEQFAGDEGFVIRWASGLRAKLKSDEYVRLHRLITQCSTRTVWECLRSGSGVDEMLDRVPPEFRDWVISQRDMLLLAHSNIASCARFDFLSIGDKPTRKEFAAEATQKPNPGLLFALLDGKPITDMVWRICEPKWERPFRAEVEE